MIDGFPRPTIKEAIEIESLTKIIRTLDDFSAEETKAMGDRKVVLFTDGTNVVLVATSGYNYPRYKTPRIDAGAYEDLNDYELVKLLKCKVNGDEVDYLIPGKCRKPTKEEVEFSR